MCRVRPGLVPGHFAVQGWRHSHIEQRKSRLKHGEEADEAISLHA